MNSEELKQDRFDYFYHSFRFAMNNGFQWWAHSALTCMKELGYSGDYNAGIVEYCEEKYSEEYED
jgi:hypothetical protein